MLNDNEMVQCTLQWCLQGYSSDISRTWPLGGSFTHAQGQVYQAVLDVQQQLIAGIQPGRLFRTLSDYLVLVLQSARISINQFYFFFNWNFLKFSHANYPGISLSVCGYKGILYLEHFDFWGFQFLELSSLILSSRPSSFCRPRRSLVQQATKARINNKTTLLRRLESSQYVNMVQGIRLR